MYAFGIKHMLRWQDDETGARMLTIKGTIYKHTTQRPQGFMCMFMLVVFSDTRLSVLAQIVITAVVVTKAALKCLRKQRDVRDLNMTRKQVGKSLIPYML